MKILIPNRLVYLWMFFVASIALMPSARAQTSAFNGYCAMGGGGSVTSGLKSSNYLQVIVPGCTVKVYLTGTTNIATIYKDASNTPLANPFTATTIQSTQTGQWLFYAATGQGYDVVMTGGITPNTFPSPVTLTDLIVGTGGGGTGCTTSGAAGTLQASNGSGGCQPAAVQVGGVNLTTPSPVNFVAGTNVTITNGSAGNITISASGGGGGCATTGTGIFQLSNGTGGCTSALADYNVSETDSFDFHPADNFNINLQGGSSNNFNVTNAGDDNFTPVGAFNVSSEAGFQVSNTVAGNVTISNTAVGGFLDISTQGNRNDSVHETYNISAHAGMNISVDGGDLDISAPHVQVFAPFQIWDTAGDGDVEFDNSTIQPADAFIYTLPRLTGTLGLYTGSLTANDCVKVNGTGNGFVDSGAGCGGSGGVTSINTVAGGFTFSFSAGAGSCSGTTCTFTGSGSGGGSVTNVIAGTLPSFLGLTIATSTSTPTLNFTASAIPNSALATQTANTVLGALTATTPSGLAMPSCSGGSNALIWTSGTGFGCNTISAGSSAFSALTSGTNTTAAMLVGTGASLGVSGSGTIAATSAPASGLTGSTLASGVTASSLTSVGTLTGGATGAGFTIALSTSTITGTLVSARGGTGVSNTATLTLGTSNQNWATIGTGIVKVTTTTGAISDAANTDVIGLWTGSCSSTTFLRGDGACAAASGSSGISGLTAGFIPIAGSATTITANSHIDDGVTTPSILTSTEPIAVTGPNNGSIDFVATGSTLGSVPANTVRLAAPNAVTAFEMDLPAAQPSVSNQFMTCTNANPSICSFSTVTSTSTALVVASAEVVSFSATPTFSTSVNVSRIVLTNNITSFTLGAGSDGQDKTLCFKQGAGPFTVTPPANVHGGFFSSLATSTSGLWNCQSFAYDLTDSMWLSTTPGVINQ